MLSIAQNDNARQGTLHGKSVVYNGSGASIGVLAAGPPGVRGAQRARHRVYPQRSGGVHQGQVRPREGTRHTAKGPLGPGQHNGVGVAGAVPAPTSGTRGGAAGAPGITKATTVVPARFIQPPPISAQKPHTYAQRAHNTHSPARLPLPLGRHPGLLPFGNSAFGTPHHTTPHHTTPHHTTPHHTTPHHTTPHHTTPHHTTPHHTTPHHTTTHHTTPHHTTPHHTTPHHTTPHHTTPHHTTPHHTTQHNTTQHTL